MESEGRTKDTTLQALICIDQIVLQLLQNLQMIQVDWLRTRMSRLQDPEQTDKNSQALEKLRQDLDEIDRDHSKQLEGQINKWFGKLEKSIKNFEKHLGKKVQNTKEDSSRLLLPQQKDCLCRVLALLRQSWLLLERPTTAHTAIELEAVSLLPPSAAQGVRGRDCIINGTTVTSTPFP